MGTAERILASYVADLTSRTDVVWMDRPMVEDPRRPATLRVAPLQVGALLAERLFRRQTVVLTSATLALGGSFEPLARQWGLPRPGSEAEPPGTEPPGTEAPGTEAPGTGTETPDPEPPGPEAAGGPETGAAAAGESPQEPSPHGLAWSGLDVGSPFDHPHRGILYVAKHLPPPGRDGLPPAYLTELSELITAAGGRTLGLFSSMRAARQAALELRGALSVPLFCQGDDSTGQLIRQFAEYETSCLFGTLSLWQGVDVPGRRCSWWSSTGSRSRARTTRWPPPGSGWWGPAAATGSWLSPSLTRRCCSPRGLGVCCAPWTTGAWWRSSIRGWPPRGTAASCGRRCRRSGLPRTRQ